MLTITSVLIILGLLFGGTGVATVAAQDSMPGEALYTIKTATEDFRFIFTNSAEAELDEALEFVNRRVAEAAAMAEQGEVYTNDDWKLLAERLEKNLKDALLAVAAVEDPESSLIKLQKKIYMWEEDFKRDQDRDGTYFADDVNVNAPSYRYQYRHMFTYMLQLVDEALGDPNEFQQTFQHRFGQDAENLELLTSTDEGVQPVDGAGQQGAQTKSGDDQGYGPEDNQFGEQNKGKVPSLENQNQGEGYGPAGDDVGSQNKAGGSDSQNQGGSGSQKP